MAEQVSNKAIVALIIMTILVTVAGTLLFLNSADSMNSDTSGVSLSDQLYDGNGMVELAVGDIPRPGPDGAGKIELKVI